MPQSFYEEFGRRVARRRAILRLKQYQVAAAIGTKRSYISALEHGRQHMMHLDRLMTLAKVLKTSSDYLLQLVNDDPGAIPPRPCAGEARRSASTSLPLRVHPL